MRISEDIGQANHLVTRLRIPLRAPVTCVTGCSPRCELVNTRREVGDTVGQAFAYSGGNLLMRGETMRLVFVMGLVLLVGAAAFFPAGVVNLISRVGELF